MERKKVGECNGKNKTALFPEGQQVAGSPVEGESPQQVSWSHEEPQWVRDRENRHVHHEE